MSATNPTPGTARSRGVNSGDSVWLDGQLVTFLLTGEETGGRFALVRATARRGWEPPCHLHRREDETLCVLAGEVTCYIGGEPRPVLAGTCVYLARGLEHGFVVESDEATILHLFTPAGYEGAIRELGMVASSNTAPPAVAGLPDVERLVTVAARYGCEITGPPLHPRPTTPRDQTTPSPAHPR